MPRLYLHFDLRAPSIGAPASDLYRAFADMAAWADEHGFDLVRLGEHHGADDGYCPSPLLAMAAAASRTRRVRLRIAALLAPFHHSLRLAEDLAVLDLLSGGRAEVLLGTGYREAEFEMFGVEYAERGRILDATIDVLRQAWTGEPFAFEGRTVRVTPVPVQPADAIIKIGGSGPASARRAARLDLDYVPIGPELVDVYDAERARLGLAPRPRHVTSRVVYVRVAEDPDADWDLLGPFGLHEVGSYYRWLTEAGREPKAFQPATTVDELRRNGPFRVLRPEQCIEMASQMGDADALILHPLVGGMPPEQAWPGLELFAEQVLPAIRPATAAG